MFTLCSTAFLMKTANFFGIVENGFLPATRHNDITGTRNILQKMRFCIPNPTMSSLTL